MSIWNFENLLDADILLTTKLKLDNDLETPVDEILFHDSKLYLKREDRNPTGSHKDRGMQFEISAYISQGVTDFVISSSGNSSISAIHLLRDRTETLHIFLSPRLTNDKVTRLEEALRKTGELSVKDGIQRFGKISIEFSDRSVSSAFKYSKKTGATLLRGSTSKYGYVGYMTIAYELASQLPDATDIFVPTSSGTTAVGIYEGYKRLESLKKITSGPRIHVCQSTKVNTFARDYDKDFKQTEESLAKSIVDRVGHRKNQVSNIIKDSKGSGWVISDSEICYMDGFVHDSSTISPEGRLAVAAYRKALDNGWEMSVPVILITGKER